MRTKKVSVSVLLPEMVNEKIKEFAARSGRTRSACIRQILRRYIRYMETKDDADATAVDWEI